MTVTIATEQDVPIARPRRMAHVLLRFGILDMLLAAWAVMVLLIGSRTVFGELPPFLGPFDVSIAPF